MWPPLSSLHYKWTAKSAVYTRKSYFGTEKFMFVSFALVELMTTLQPAADYGTADVLLSTRLSQTFHLVALHIIYAFLTMVRMYIHLHNIDLFEILSPNCKNLNLRLAKLCLIELGSFTA